MRVSGSRFGLLSLGLVFSLVGVWFVVASVRADSRFGLAFCVFWLATLWWFLINYAYHVVLLTNGDMRFRLLWGGRRLVNAMNVKAVRARSGEGSRWLVIRGHGPGVRMADSSDNREVIRRLAEMNPAIKLPKRFRDMPH
jgi:hypothetical protein